MKNLILLSIITSLNVMSMYENRQQGIKRPRKNAVTEKSVNDLNITPKNVDSFIKIVHGVFILDLSSQELTSLDGLLNIPKIEEVQLLNLANNNFRECHPNLDILCNQSLGNNFNKLEWLNLNSNQLSKIPRLRLPNLKSLNLEDNRISSISLSSFNDVPELEVLYLGNNALSNETAYKMYNPNTYKKLTNLRLLKIDNNNLKKMPDFKYLTNLQKLNISGNRIDISPEDVLEIFKLKRLQSMITSTTEFKRSHDTIVRLNRLNTPSSTTGNITNHSSIKQLITSMNNAQTNRNI